MRTGNVWQWENPEKEDNNEGGGAALVGDDDNNNGHEIMSWKPMSPLIMNSE